ncbi:hypothetical protein BGZ72_003613, partial [Mortierella alpina]
MGEVVPEGPDRGKRPISSKYEERKRTRKGGIGLDWNEEARAQGLTPTQVDRELEGLESTIKELEAQDKAVRKTLADKLATQSARSLEHRQLSRKNQPESDMLSVRKAAYKNLQLARTEVRQ